MNAAARDDHSLNCRRMVLIFATLFVSYAYFYEGGGWNQNSRFDLIRAIVERGTLRIDAYHENTEDKARYQGHYYSDKAPGLALLAVPVVAAGRPILRAAGLDPDSPGGLVALSYAATVFTVALPTALACACLFWVGLRLGSNAGGAAFGALSLGLATPLWAYATLLWGHALVGACLLFAFAACVGLREAGSPRRDRLLGLAVGLAAGWATVSEYPAAPASAILAVLALAQIWSAGWARRWRVAASIGVGALACVVILLLYQYAAFGSPFHLGYSYYEEGAFPWMTRGFLGLTYPRVDVLLKLLLGCHRGLLLLAPVVAAAPFGMRLLWKKGETPSLAAVAIAAYYVLFNASFSGWHGGWSYGPRYLAAGIPALCIGLAPLWSAARRKGRILLAVLAAYGGFLALVAVATTAQPPQEFSCPVVQLLWPSFWAGRLSLEQTSILAPWEETPGRTHGAFNLGQLAGMQGLASLVPLLAVWAGAAFVWVRMGGEIKRDAGS